MEIKLGTKKEKKELMLDAHTGKNGDSAYEVAVKSGFSGTEEEWLASLKGEKGDKGEKGKELKTSIIIGNAQSGATTDSCDFLYNDGDDFAEIFEAASELAKGIGIFKIELLSGKYYAKSTVIINSLEVVGIGSVEILPYYGEEQSGSTLILRGDRVYLENLTVGKSAGEHCIAWAGASEINMDRVETLGGALLYTAKFCLENCKINGCLRIIKSSNSRITNCDIESINGGNSASECIITGCRIGEIADMPNCEAMRNNVIGGKLQKQSVTERLMNVSFGRITTTNATDTVKRIIESGSFEIYINEGKNMTVNLYTGNSETPAKTLSSDVFIFISGNPGDDVVDGSVYQKTLILYMKSTLGVASLSKWIALSDSDVHDNVKIEIICPPNTYRGVMNNREDTVYCND